MIWYPASSGDLDRDGAQFRYRESVDMQMATALQAWLKRDDPREPMGAIVLVQYGGSRSSAVRTRGAAGLGRLQASRPGP